MKRIRPEDAGLDVGIDLDFEGTLWRNPRTQKCYILPLRREVEIHTPAVIDIDNLSELDALNRAFLIENQRFFGTRKQVSKAALGISKTQVEQRIAWEVFRRDGFKCVYCCSEQGPMTYDHYVPVSAGGATNIENGKTACKWCNHHKTDMDPSDWLTSDLLKKRINQIKKSKHAATKTS